MQQTTHPIEMMCVRGHNRDRIQHLIGTVAHHQQVAVGTDTGDGWKVRIFLLIFN